MSRDAALACARYRSSTIALTAASKLACASTLRLRLRFSASVNVQQRWSRYATSDGRFVVQCGSNGRAFMAAYLFSLRQSRFQATSTNFSSLSTPFRRPASAHSCRSPRPSKSRYSVRRDDVGSGLLCIIAALYPICYRVMQHPRRWCAASDLNAINCSEVAPLFII